MKEQTQIVDNITDIEKCIHCESFVDGIQYFDSNNNVFCCLGCKTVYSIINSEGLSEYYDLKSQSSDKSKPAFVSNKQYLYLDTKDFLTKYAIEDHDNISMMFYVEGVHCMACLWLMQKIPDIFDSVMYVDFNWSKSTLKVIAKKEIKFSAVAKKLDIFGYQVHAIENEDEAEVLAKKEERKDLVRIGVAAACAGNIMIYAVSLYGGVTGDLASFFGKLSLVLCLPAIFYSAVPFYKNAYSSLITKKISIDIPISFAIFITMIHGSYNILSGTSQHHFFDSITILIFLLLLTRQLLKRVQKNGLKTKSLSSFFNDGEVLVKEEGNVFKMKHLDQVEIGDILKIDVGRSIPCDGEILKGESKLNTSLLTGESRAQLVSAGDEVFAGTVNLENEILMKVTTSADYSRLGKILKAVSLKNKKQTLISTYSEQVSQFFTIAIMTMALLTFISLSMIYNVEVAIWRSLALIIITCPCALALATPLAMSLAISKARENGVLIKDDSVIEKVSKAKSIYFDKTGTLTYGNPKVIDWIYEDGTDSVEIDSIVLELEHTSTHPLAKSIVEYLSTKKSLTQKKVINKNEIFGRGIEGTIDDHFYELKSLKDNKYEMTAVGLYRNKALILTILLKDQIRDGASELIEKLSSSLNVYLLSGDNDKYVEAVGNELGISKNRQFSSVSPEQKEKVILESHSSIMVGDGANDAIALRNSLVGVAMHGAMDVSLRSADVYIGSSRHGLSSLSYLTDLSHITMTTIKRNLVLSLLYNVVGISLAITGNATPLVAAILMPLSSLTVFVSTIISLNFEGKK